MKKILPWLLLCAALSGGAARAFVYENAWELQSVGDFDGDGRQDLIILDKATGNYRIGYQLSAGVYTWVSARASGMAGATGLGIGKLDSTSFDSLAIAGPDANRVNILDANSPAAAGLPASAFISALGPNVAAVIGIGGCTPPLDDLYVASIYNDYSAGAYRETLVCNSGPGSLTGLPDNVISGLRERANSVLLRTNAPVRLALFERNIAAGMDALRIIDTSGGSAAIVASIVTNRVPNPYEYVTGQFIRTNSHTQFLLYSPATGVFNEYQVIEPTAGVFGLAYINPFTVTNMIDRVFVLPGTNGLKLLVFDTNQISATVYAFDGQTPAVPIQYFSATNGEHFTGAGVLGNAGFVAYSAPAGQNTSAKFHEWDWNGAGYTSGVSGDLPRVSTYSSSGNVMQFQFEPFVNSNPILLRLNNAGDWFTTPSFSGSPGNISVTTETFISSNSGLENPTALSLGPAHAQAHFALANQYSNMVSLFSFTPPAGDKISDVTISPAPGLYQSAVQLQFTAANAGDTIRFRIAAGPWTTWASGLIARVFTNAAVQYYGQPATGIGKSAVKSAAYTFSQGPSTLDSNGDGIPDYVAIAKGLDPNGGADSDGDGYSDLEELIHGTDPLNAGSVPSGFPHLDSQGVFDLVTTPLPWDGFSNTVSLSATGTVLRAQDLQGSLLSEDTVSNLYPAVRLTNIAIVVEDRLVACATEQHYFILTTNVDQKVGREMVGLVPVPAQQLPTVTYVYGGGNITNEANAWIAAASNAFNNLPRATLTNRLGINQSLESLLFEMKTAQILGARGSNWWTNLTLFPFRTSDAGRTNPAQATLLALESKTTNQPGYKLQTMSGAITNLVEGSSGTDIANLRAVVQDIYRIDSVQNNTNPAAFALPVDEIRYFLWNGTLESNYLYWSTTTLPQRISASNGVSAILAAVPPRPTTNVMLVVRGDTVAGSCRNLDLLSASATFTLVDVNGAAYVFPSGFQLPPGSVVQVSGYTDASGASCGYPAIEVISAALNSVPIATDSDQDGNLLIDTWENKFFGALGIANPFDDSDGDGYSNLQEMLEGSDPRDHYGIPAVPPVHFAAPMLVMIANGSQLELHFQWPAAYISRFNFGVRVAATPGGPWVNLPSAGPQSVTGDEFKMVVTPPGYPESFYLLTVSLH